MEYQEISKEDPEYNWWRRMNNGEEIPWKDKKRVLKKLGDQVADYQKGRVVWDSHSQGTYRKTGGR